MLQPTIYYYNINKSNRIYLLILVPVTNYCDKTTK